jgi:hypothetical protein
MRQTARKDGRPDLCVMSRPGVITGLAWTVPAVRIRSAWRTHAGESREGRRSLPPIRSAYDRNAERLVVRGTPSLI